MAFPTRFMFMMFDAPARRSGSPLKFLDKTACKN